MIGWIIILILLILLLIYLFTLRNYQSLPVVVVDLDKYQGLWYEIARLPAFFQKGCIGTTARYALNKNATISVTNQCYRNGSYTIANGVATPRGPPITPNTVLYLGSFDVKFEKNPFKGDYNVLYVDSDYQTALVGTSNRKYLWILSRNRFVDPKLYTFLINYANKLGFDTSKLIIDSR